jgi:hypothetical protein
MKKYYYLSLIVLSVIFITGVSLVFAQSWQPPDGPPPGNNAEPPVNVSNLSQTKAGNLWAGHLLALGDLYADQSVVAPNTVQSTANTRILTINQASGEFQWREAGSWTGGGGGAIGGYEIITGPSGNPSQANCTAGKKVIGGGCSWGAGGGQNDDSTGHGYPNTNSSYWCNNPLGLAVRAYAICVSGL